MTELEKEEMRTKCIVCCESPVKYGTSGKGWCDDHNHRKLKYGTIKCPILYTEFGPYNEYQDIG